MKDTGDDGRAVFKSKERKQKSNKAFLRCGVLDCLGCYNKIPQTAWLNNRNLFLIVLSWEVQDQGAR